MTVSKYRKRRSDKKKRQCERLAVMRAAKERKRLENPPPAREPKLVRWYPLEFCVRDKRTGHTSQWHDLRSARRMARQAALLLRFCA